eukprot:Sspe_Gene.27611::Locus_11980_Transcript_1_1_Confidence_1.000_Length_695::g.27611::m.27611
MEHMEGHYAMTDDMVLQREVDLMREYHSDADSEFDVSLAGRQTLKQTERGYIWLGELFHRPTVQEYLMEHRPDTNDEYVDFDFYCSVIEEGSIKGVSLLNFLSVQKLEELVWINAQKKVKIVTRLVHGSNSISKRYKEDFCTTFSKGTLRDFRTAALCLACWVLLPRWEPDSFARVPKHLGMEDLKHYHRPPTTDPSTEMLRRYEAIRRSLYETENAMEFLAP